MNIAKFIDHTLLKPDATQVEIAKLCTEAKEFHFAAVCVNPPFVKQCADALRGTDVAVCTVVGFPLGAHTTATKVFETQEAIANGAKEIDMVINIGALRARQVEVVRDDIRAIVDVAHRQDAMVKVIIETALLSHEELILACELVQAAGADFVKTSTGFSTRGAAVADVIFMRQTVGTAMGIKAAGGIKNLKQALAMIDAGATRIGASAGVAIVREFSKHAERVEGSRR